MMWLIEFLDADENPLYREIEASTRLEAERLAADAARRERFAGWDVLGEACQSPREVASPRTGPESDVRKPALRLFDGPEPQPIG